MSHQTETLGGRLPLLNPRDLSGAQKELYDLVNRTMVPWAEQASFQCKTEDGKLIGPFNPLLFSPGISPTFLKLQEVEQQHTTLSERERQVVILTVGAVWQSDYERYAHSAVGRKAGLSEDAIRTLAADGLPEDLSDREKLAQRYTRQLSAEHRVDAALYRDAEQALGKQGLVDLTYLAGIYHLICATLNGFAIPSPV